MRPSAPGILLCVCAAVPAAAQDTAAPEVGFSSVPFRFFPPGARSLGMGSTFVAVADDATAATANPAGLVILPQPEVSFHGRLTHLQGTTRTGTVPTSTDPSTRMDVSFLSAVYPRGRLRASAYYQQVSDFEITHRASGDYRFLLEGGQADVARVQSATSVDLKLAEVGVGAAARIGSHLSVGVSVARRRLSLVYDNRNTLVTPGRPTFRDQAQADAADGGLAFNAGMIVNPARTVSAGFVFKRGGRFRLPYTVDYEGSFGPASCVEGGACDPAALAVPDVWGTGVAYRPTGAWMVSADLSLLRYSQLGRTPLRRIPIDLYPPLTNQFLPPRDFKDVVQINVGGERVFIGEPLVAVRLGASHRPEFHPGGTVATSATFGTAGAGIVFRDRLQLDVAGSASGELREALTSIVVRF